MIGLQVIEILILFVIAVEIYLISNNKEVQKGASNNRRELNGTFKDPLGYKTNTRGQYVPIKPNSKLIDGSEDDEI